MPIDIPLPERAPLENGAMFVVLRTLDELEAFWLEHRARFPYAASACPSCFDYDEQLCLDDYEWVFGPTKASVVNAVFRWDQIGIECTWYDWASDAPGALVRLRAR